MIRAITGLILASGGAGIVYNSQTSEPNFIVNGVPLVSTGVSNYCVDGVSGKDTATCLCSNAPCATLQAAVNKLPYCWTDAQDITIDGGSYAGAIIERQPWCNTSADGGVAYLRIHGSPVLATLAQGTASGTSSAGVAGTNAIFATLTDGTQNWAVNALTGLELCLGGAGCPKGEYDIKSNTATVITAAISNLVASANPFQSNVDQSGFAASIAYSIFDWGSSLTPVTLPSENAFPYQPANNLGLTAKGGSVGRLTDTDLLINIPGSPYDGPAVIVDHIKFTGSNEAIHFSGGGSLLAANNNFGAGLSGVLVVGANGPLYAHYNTISNSNTRFVNIAENSSISGGQSVGNVWTVSENRPVWQNLGSGSGMFISAYDVGTFNNTNLFRLGKLSGLYIIGSTFVLNGNANLLDPRLASGSDGFGQTISLDAINLTGNTTGGGADNSLIDVVGQHVIIDRNGTIASVVNGSGAATEALHFGNNARVNFAIAPTTFVSSGSAFGYAGEDGASVLGTIGTIQAAPGSSPTICSPNAGCIGISINQ